MSEPSEPKRRFFSGDTLQQALVQAANYFHLDPEEIAYQSIEKRHGFLKARRRVVIEVDPDSPRRPPGSAPVMPPLPTPPPRPAMAVTEGEPGEEVPARAMPPPTPAPREERPGRREERPQGRREGGPGRGERGARGERGDRGERRGPAPERRERREGPPGRERGLRFENGRQGVMPVARPVADVDLDDSLIVLPERPRPVGDRYPIATGPIAEAAQKGLDLLLGVANLRLDTKIYQGEERLEIDMSGEDADFCFDSEGELLRAIEHLLPRVIRSLSGVAIPCRVDCESFHEIREEQLRTMAQRIAADVRRRGRSRTLEPMNPADRRIVHMTLADDPGVETESEGEGYFKRVTVRPI
jgi:predicted RNA-binding protein Jag